MLIFNTYNWVEVAQNLNMGFGRNTLLKKLRYLEILDEDNYPYYEYLNEGYFEVHSKDRTTQRHKSDIVILTTGKGFNFLKKVLSSH